MNVLWIVNTIFPAPSKALGLQPPIFGGWMYDSATRLASTTEFNLAVATTYNGKEPRFFNLEGILYYLLVSKSKKTYPKNLEEQWARICSEFKPDIIHIHGTEFTHGLACMRACPSLNYVISIQGLVSIISKYYYGGISKWDLLKNITFRDLVRSDTVFHAKNKLKKRGIYEKEYLCRTKHVIGRTFWDYAHSIALNPKIEYHFCNESLRKDFYNSPKWDINKKSDFTIFLSQASYPIKGLHQVLKAVSLLKDDFKTISIRIAGVNITDTSTLRAKLRLNGYGAYIKRLVEKLGLQENLQFLGPLNEEQMITEYLNSHLFICPSCIENSPNSLGEAQMLGVPCIAAYVGGVSDMIENNISGFIYRFEEVEILATLIRNVFNSNNVYEISNQERTVALQRHDYSTNIKMLMDIYLNIIS